MSDDDPVVVMGTRRAMRELVDGVIRVQIDIDPPYRLAFLRLFPNIDTPVAIAPLKIGPQALKTPSKLPTHQPPPEPPAADDPDPRDPHPTPGLTRLAGIWCRDPEFQVWLAAQVGEHIPATAMGEDPAEDTAKRLRAVLGIASRRELDTDPEAAAMFDQLIREPYRAHLSLHP